MAIFAGANAGARGAHGPSDADLSGPALGVSASVALSTTPANLALPTDANGNLYPAYFFATSTPCWMSFCTANTDTVTPAGANAYLINIATTAVNPFATPQAMLNKQVGAFVSAASLTGTGYLNVIGVF